jgi:hypothetical protein
MYLFGTNPPAAAIEAAVVRGLQQAKQQQQQQQQAQGWSQLQPQQLYLQDVHHMFAGSSTDAMLQQLPSSLTRLDLSSTNRAQLCSLSSTTLAAFTRLRSLSIIMEGSHWPPSVKLTALQQLQDLEIIGDGNEEEVLRLQQRLPQQLQHFTLFWWSSC